jgi:hypothetical protein
MSNLVRADQPALISTDIAGIAFTAALLTMRTYAIPRRQEAPAQFLTP